MIPLFKVHMPDEVSFPLMETLFSGYVGEGPRVKDFEAALARFLHAKNVLATNSCTSAIQLALRLANVGVDDEVITTPMTCTATNEPIMAAGARIVWADIDAMTGNIDANSIRERITANTKAVVVVHWGGYPVDLDEIRAVSRDHGIPVIEDAAHAFGSEYQGEMIGNHSDFVCFSFQAIKHITTVDGGALVCAAPTTHERGRLLRWYGIDREQPGEAFRCEADIAEWGYKFHMNDVAAAIGLVQMKYAQGIVSQRQGQAHYYDEVLGDTDGVTILTRNSDRKSAYWLYTMHVERRLDFMRRMGEHGIMVSQVHTRNDTHTMFRHFQACLPGVDSFTESMVCIPIGFWVGEEDQEAIVACIKEGW